MLKLGLVAALALVPSLAAADEVVIERSRPGPVEVVPPPPPPDEVVIERRARDCRTSRTTTEADDGSSSTVTRRDCD